MGRPIKFKVVSPQRIHGIWVGDLHYPAGVKIVMDDYDHRNDYDVDEVIKAMDEIVDKAKFKKVNPSKGDYYDCEDRAKWVLAQIRSNPHNERFWGIAIGEARGRKDPTSEKHAVIVLWKPDKKTRIYYDPYDKTTGKFHPTEIIA